MNETFTFKQLITALVAIRTGTPVGQTELTAPNFFVFGVGPHLPDDLTDLQGLVDAVDNACSEHLDGDKDGSTYCMYEMTKLFKRSAQTINRWAKTGRIPAYRTPEGRLTGLFPKFDIDTLLEGGVL